MKQDEKDDILVSNISQILADCTNDMRSMRHLLKRINGAKLRMLERPDSSENHKKALTLREAERELQTRMRIIGQSPERTRA